MLLVNEFLPIGRIDRFGFWWRHLLVLPVALALCVSMADHPGAPFDLLPVVATTLFVVSTWGRRLHDRGHSAAWLVAVLVPVVGAVLLWIECGLRGSLTDRADGAPAVPYRTV